MRERERKIAGVTHTFAGEVKALCGESKKRKKREETRLNAEI